MEKNMNSESSEKIENYKYINNKRDTNVGVLRIIAMLMVITLHCINHSKVVGNSNLNIVNLFGVRFLDCLAIIANNIFLIISGYYLIDKNFKLKKILNLWGKTIFYSLLIYFVCLIFNQKVNILYSFTPILSGQYWFITSYIVLYFLAPIINKLINNITKEQHKYLIIVLIVVYGFIRILFNFSTIFHGSIPIVILLYIIGAYIRKYVKIDKSNKYFIKYIFTTIIITCLYIILKALSNIFETNEIIYAILYRIINMFRDFSNILIVLSSVFLFLKFKTINIKSDALIKLTRNHITFHIINLCDS